MRKLILVILLLIPLVYGIEECQRQVTPAEIPCLIISSWIRDNCTVNMSIFNSTGAAIQNISFYSYIPNCAANFTLTQMGIYQYNSSLENGIITIVSDDNMIYLLFIPMALCFLFIYWANSLTEEQEGWKWFMRLLSILFIFVVYIGADIIIGMNPEYEGLSALFNITAITWIFYTCIGTLLTYVIYKIFSSLKNKKKSDFEEGILR